MKFGFLMIILTLLENGQMSAAFVNTQTLEECENRATVVRGILEKGDVDIKEMACRPSETEFEPFLHGTEEDAERFAYVIMIDDASARVEQVASCEAVSTATAGQYCATSTQNLAPKNQ